MTAFSDIIGQKAIIEHLCDALRTGSVSHAYILNGDTGSGRKMIAYTFAATLQCENPQEVNGILEPCGKCLSCIQAQTGNQPDIITIRHEKPGSIGVKEIRNMRADLQIRPYANAHKVYIVPDAEKLTVQAQNALLKTLEEPPEYAVILLLANGLSAFLPTVLSRCITLQVRPVGEEQIAQLLLKRGSAEEEPLAREQAEMIARFSGGNPGRALQLAHDAEFVALRERTMDLLRRIRHCDSAELAAFASSVEAERREDFLYFVQIWFRDILLYRSTEEENHLLFTGELPAIREAAQALSMGSLGSILDAIDLASRRLRTNVSAEVTLEMLLLQIRREYGTGGF